MVFHTLTFILKKQTLTHQNIHSHSIHILLYQSMYGQHLLWITPPLKYPYIQVGSPLKIWSRELIEFLRY